ncbi:MAG: hypothetical protein HYU36_20425 [Planctomycetes bacterium]|nr:hypothetical protein [Planctomycetota bacterium]
MKRRILGPIEKRDLLHSERSRPEDLAAYGRLYLDQGRLSDALDFFSAAREPRGIEQVKAAGIERGDSFILRRLEKIQPGCIQAKDWEDLGDQAWKLGKFRDALEAFSRAGHAEKEAMAKNKLGIPSPDSNATSPGGSPGDSGPAAPQ